eukprot:TRINITY_DN80418_c0_g1_i1.p1 TRINITY_DN80418_c0_g1~~TRINITY_DN80418_c0_g1_i1.p1  ORF type:complete len:455 (-),score=47.21 TRINITY_DN80418_c0_g1_i1:282-1520(-)
MAGDEEEEDADIAGSVDKMRPLLQKAFARGGNVAIITFQGTLCPVTVAHIEAVKETRLQLLGEASERLQVAERPQKLPHFQSVFAFIGLNPDDYVASKFGGRRASTGFIPADERRALVDLATGEHDWIHSCWNVWKCADKLMSEFKEQGLVWYELDGADVALRSRTWNRAWEGRRYACVGRPADPGAENGTHDVVRRMEEDGKGPSSEWYQEGSYLLLPELPRLSSTQARQALKSEDMTVLNRTLHEHVLQELLPSKRGSRQARSKSIAALALYVTAVASLPSMISDGRQRVPFAGHSVASGGVGSISPAIHRKCATLPVTVALPAAASLGTFTARPGVAFVDIGSLAPVGWSRTLGRVSLGLGVKMGRVLRGSFSAFSSVCVMLATLRKKKPTRHRRLRVPPGHFSRSVTV